MDARTQRRNNKKRGLFYVVQVRKALTDSNIEKLSIGVALDLGDFSIIPIKHIDHEEVQGILDQYRNEFEEWLKSKYNKNVFDWWTVSEYPEDVTEYFEKELNTVIE